MPRLRAVRTKEEAEKVPQDQSVAVILPDENAPVELEPADPQVELSSEPPKAHIAEDPPAPQSDELKTLKEQLEQARNAEIAAQNALRQREQAMAEERERLLSQTQQHREQAQEARYTAILNALGAAQAESEAAMQAFEQADSMGDSKLKAEAQRRLAKAEALVARHEEAKEAFEARATAPKEPPTRASTERQQDPLEAAISSMPPGAQNWLREHSQYMTDPRKNAKLQAVHWDVLDEGHAQFSPAYFQSLEEHLGLRQKAPAQNAIEDDDPPPPPRSRNVPSAPPSRDVPSASTGRPQSSRIELTPEEREVARLSGIDELTYARNKRELERRKANGMYQERG